MGEWESGRVGEWETWPDARGRIPGAVVERIARVSELRVYERAFALAMEIFERTKTFPREERYSMTDQIRRSSRSVCANIGEGWQKRRYLAAFVAKLSDAEAEAGETIVWLNFAVECAYLPRELTNVLEEGYNDVIGMLVRMMAHPDQWALLRR